MNWTHPEPPEYKQSPLRSLLQMGLVAGLGVVLVGWGVLGAQVIVCDTLLRPIRRIRAAR